MKDLHDKIKGLTHPKKFDKNYPNFIKSINFPFYKNLKPSTKINFKYPFSVFVGPNGCGKSTVLHALETAPVQKSLSSRWFSTHVDPIKETSKNGIRNCFWYEYFNIEAQDTAQVLNTRIKKKDNPDYWEPSRPIQKYGMNPFTLPTNGKAHPGRSRTRWNGIQKSILYIDFRSELSAFDKFFYFENPPVAKAYKTKQDYIRHRSKYLKEVFDKKLDSKELYGKERVHQCIDFDVETVKEISEILGKNYTNMILVEHSLYQNTGFSVLFSTDRMSYTEAFAGSGEMSVVKLVYQVMKSDENSLILLDEPEVSLHPGAQQRLVKFLFKKCIENRHQIILSTHSPAIVDLFPKEAIKVFIPNGEGYFEVKEDITSELAFQYIGHRSKSNISILVEDEAAKQLLEKVLKSKDDHLGKIIDISFHGGGSKDLFKEALVLSRLDHKKTYFYLDGDQYIRDIPENEDISDSELDSIIKEVTGVKVHQFGFCSDSDNEQQIMNEKRKFLSFLKTNFFYFSGKDPEDTIWISSKYKDLPKKQTNETYKDAIERWVTDDLDEVNSQYISTYRSKLLKHIDLTHDYVKQISGNLDRIESSI